MRALYLFLFAFLACHDQPFDAGAPPADVSDTSGGGTGYEWEQFIESLVPLGPVECEVECPASPTGDDVECIDAPATIDEAVMLLESQGYFVAKDIEVLDRPAGFPEEDEFPLELHEWSEKDGGMAMLACEVITKRELKRMSAPKEWFKPIYSYCRWRVMNSSRAWQLGKQVESRVDGTPVHDRDLSSASYFYGIAVKTGRMNPKTCPHHRMPSLHVEHPQECSYIADNYEKLFKRKLDPDRKKRWLDNSHAFEKFGARGPVDWNAYHGYKAISGCYPFTAFDRTDVGVTAVVRRSIKICTKYECAPVSTTRYILPHWNESI